MARSIPAKLVNPDGSDLDVTTPPAVQGDLAAGAADTGTNPIKIGGIAYSSGAMPTFAGGQRTAWSMGTRGAGAVTLYPENSSTPVATAAPGRGSSGTLVVLRTGARLELYNGTTYDPLQKAGVARLISAAASVNATSVKTTSADLFRVGGYNASAALRYLKIYNKGSAPTVGTDTPLLTIPLEPSKPFSIALGGTGGIYLSAGLAYAITTGAADNDTGVLTAGDVTCLSLDYA
jgi:hypothetical protein